MISVIIPVYNPNESFEKCVKTLESQNIDLGLYEVIFVVNGDIKYLEICKKVLLNIKFNYILHYTELKGVSNARNIGVELSSGNYICFIDSDDYVSNNYLRNLYELSKNDTTIIISNVIKVEKNKTDENFYLTKRFKQLSYSSDSFDIYNYRQFMSTVWGKLIPKYVIGENKFVTDVSQAEDALFMATISKNTSDFILTNNDCVYYYKYEENSLSNNKRNRVFINKLKTIPYFLILLNKKGYNKKFVLSRIAGIFKGTIIEFIKEVNL